MSSAPMLHTFEKVDYSKHHLVTLPPSPPPSLPLSSLRLQSKILGLTTNNFSYARLGHVLGWWDIYPQPDETPAPYNDRTIYACIPATVYGFLPTSTHPEDVLISHTGLKNQIFVKSPHRQHVWAIYNRYRVEPPLEELVKAKGWDSLGWDALMQGLFGTAYNLNKYGFAWDDECRIHPGGAGEWTAGDANLDDSTVILLNASGKTGTSFAYNLRHQRPKAHQPRTLIGVGSPASKDMLEKSGLYDAVMLNSENQSAKGLIEQSGTRRIVLVDFGAREGATAAWRAALSSSTVPFTFVAVGAECKPQHPDESRNRITKMSDVVLVNASELREKGISLGGDTYFDEFYDVWDRVKSNGAIPAMTLKWDEGMEAWGKGWEALCKDEVPASTGLVYRV